jgi:hypothetical protein
MGNNTASVCPLNLPEQMRCLSIMIQTCQRANPFLTLVRCS